MGAWNWPGKDALRISVSSVESMRPEDIEGLFTRLDEYGAAVIHCLERMGAQEATEDFLKIKQLFGQAVWHKRSGSDGISVVSNELAYDPLFLATTTSEHPLHTDGPFLKSPPAVVAMQCVKRPAIGGQSVLLSSAALFEHLQKECGDAVLHLFSNDAFGCQRGDEVSIQPICKLVNGRVRMRYRYDDVVSIVLNPHAREIFFDCIVPFVRNPLNATSFNLEIGEILVLDNYAVLHGRTAFTGIRRLNRLWLMGQGSRIERGSYGFRLTSDLNDLQRKLRGLGADTFMG